MFLVHGSGQWLNLWLGRPSGAKSRLLESTSYPMLIWALWQERNRRVLRAQVVHPKGFFEGARCEMMCVLTLLVSTLVFT